MALLAALVSQALNSHCKWSASAETRVIPSINVSERFDSNVWFAPSDRLPPGTKAWDLVSSVSPVVEVLNKSRLDDTRFSAGVTGAFFANNSVLNYVSTNAGVNSNLTGWIRKLIPGATLQVADGFFFTPEPPGFITGVKPQTPADTFARGVIAFRANTFTNYATISGGYPFSRSAGMQASYSNSFFRVGQVFQASPAEDLQNYYFNSIAHYGSIGPWYNLSPKDTIGINYQPSYISTSGGGTTVSFAAHSVVLDYTRTTPDWTLGVSGGPAYLEQGSFFYYNGAVSVTTNYDKPTRLRLTLSRQLTPAFFATGGGLISNTAGFSIDSKLAKNLPISANLYYAHNAAVPVEIVKFESFLANVRLNYPVTRTFLISISYNYNLFDQSGMQTAGTVQSFQFDRHFITFSFTSTWK
jgi:hypothetical protein